MRKTRGKIVDNEIEVNILYVQDILNEIEKSRDCLCPGLDSELVKKLINTPVPYKIWKINQPERLNEKTRKGCESLNS